METESTFSEKAVILALVILPIFAVVIAIILLWNQYVFVSDLVLLAVLYSLAILGIGVGYHRMLTHTAFETYNAVRAFFLILGVTAFEGQPGPWAATHIKHHAHSDEEGDPHSPLDGFWHAHLGWLFKGLDHPKDYAPHLLKDPVVVAIDKYAGLIMLASLVIPYLLGGWTALIWAGGVRIFLTTHITWSVNSICHTFGSRDFETTDHSRNNWIFGLLAFGEGWHNNHHAFPQSAFHGLRWWQIDFSGMLIRFMESIGLVWNVKRVSLETQEAQKRKTQTMYESLMQLQHQVMQSVLDLQKDIFEMSKQTSDEQVLLMSEHRDSVLKRLQEIQKRLAGNNNVKKSKLNAYQKEVAELASTLRRRIVPKRA